MELAFTKMHGLGNDFVLFDALEHPIALSPEQIRHIADRHHGVGCDQVLLIEPSRMPGADVHYRIFNGDGIEVGQCGNGVRCVARYLKHRHGLGKTELVVETHGGRMRVYHEADGNVRVDMGVPQLEPVEIPFVAAARAVSYPIEVDGHAFAIGVCSVGNPHAVLEVPDVDRAPVAELGPLIERHPRFPERVNAGFMQVVDANHVRLRVYERGAGETLACGTGACAAVVVGRVAGRLDESVDVRLPGGSLSISWEGEGHPVWMSGPAVTVFEGRMTL